MADSPNLKKYEAIWQAKQRSPSLKWTDLCKKYGVKYLNLNNWIKRHKGKGSPTVAASAPTPGKTPPTIIPLSKDVPIKDTVVVRVPLIDVLRVIRYNRKELIIPKDRLLNALTKEDATRLKDLHWQMSLKRGDASDTEALFEDHSLSNGEDETED